MISAQAENAIETATCPVLVVARGVPIEFASPIYVSWLRPAAPQRARHGYRGAARAADPGHIRPPPGRRLRHGVLTRPAPLARLLEEVRQARPAGAAGGHRRADRGPPASGAWTSPSRYSRPSARRWDPTASSCWFRATTTVPWSAPGSGAPPLGWRTRPRCHSTPPRRWLGSTGGWLRLESGSATRGVWLSERVWATHGHYLDRHLMPESAVGIGRGCCGACHSTRPRRWTTSWDAAHPLSRATGWLPTPIAALLDDIAELIRASTMPRFRRRFLTERYAPLISAVLRVQMSRASMPALARVVHRLGVQADCVVFGHVHRLGPLAADDPQKWLRPEGRPRILNTGSWLLRAAAAAPRQAAAPLLARRRRGAGARSGPAGHRTARRPDTRRPALSRRAHGAPGVRAGSGGCRRTRARDSGNRARLPIGIGE